MAYKYSRYIGRLSRFPWAILPEKFAVIAELMRERAAGHKVSDEEIVARLGSDYDAERPTSRQDGAIAVIPVHGTIAHRADSFEASSGGTSTELIGKFLRQAVADESVKGILLDFASPGGSVEGVPEIAAQIAKAATVKPVVAHVNALAASAGYWLASQATEIVATPSGMVGSIGVFLLMIDESEALAKEGIKVNAISAGDYKLEGAFWEPLSDEARAHFQSQVDAVYRDFLGAVAKGRGVSVADVKKNYGQGRVFDAKEALSRGMIDRIGTMDETLGRMLGGKINNKRRAMAAAAIVVQATDGLGNVVDALHEHQDRQVVAALEGAAQTMTEADAPAVPEAPAVEIVDPVAAEHAAIIASLTE